MTGRLALEVHDTRLTDLPTPTPPLKGACADSCSLDQSLGWGTVPAIKVSGRAREAG